MSDHLSHNDVMRLATAAASRGRHKERDRLLVLMVYFHAMRPSEVVDLKWAQIDLDEGLIHIDRVHGGLSSIHPIAGMEHKYLGRLRERNKREHVFVSERGQRMTASNVRHLMARVGAAAGFSYRVRPRMLRYAYARRLAEVGFDTRIIRHWMGHVSMGSTMRFVRDVDVSAPEAAPFDFGSDDTEDARRETQL